METEALHFSDYLTILRRRKKQFLVPALMILIISLVIAFILPPSYRSTATVLIEQQEIPTDLVRSTVTSYAAERIQIIRQRVETRANLSRIIEKFDLFPAERQSGNLEDVIGRVRKSIEVEMVSADVLDARGRASQATIAFELSFSSDTPEVAHEVASELVDLYLQENIRMRTQKARVTSGFLAQEEERLARDVSDLEAKLARHKEKNVGLLPELMNLNLQQMERTERELEETERQIFNLEERKIYLESQLAQLEPYTGVSPAARLRELQTQYLSASALYASGHPDLVRMRRQIDLLKKEVGSVDETGDISQQLTEVRAQLAAAREKYSDDHPDVINLRKSAATLEKALTNAPASPRTDVSLKPDNPAYISIQTQLDAARLNLKAGQEKRARARARIAEYERRLVQMPRVEQQSLALQREYESALAGHREIKQKLTQAQVAEQLEMQEKAERFSVIEAPHLPGRPDKPNRPAIVFLGLVLSFGAGVGYASLVEYMDRTIRGSKSVSTLLGAMPLAVIPNIQAEPDPYQKRRSR